MGLAELKARIQQLGPADRMEVAALLDRLYLDEPEGPLSDEWREELRQRSDQLDHGEVALVPWESVRNELGDGCL